ncbi:hypothetical protein IP70_21165 [alpha proteobacterium AAP38]|uniref:hypothetical protein n=1 Tax=Niveispirillum sp. TaxID=1917217 RepID=UPI0006B9D360|nr:hypothetical protein IP70_21165 [alpha proteobacterium AAP38]
MLNVIPWKAFYALFILLLGLFLYTLFFGYQASVLTSFPDYHPALAITAGLAAALLVGAFLRSYGRLRLAADHAGSKQLSAKFKRLSWVFVALILTLSAVGVLTAATLVFEGPVILREDLDRARDRLTQLREASRDSLRLPEYEGIRAQVESKLTALRNEITAPGNCGMGSQARQRFQEIRELLPDLKPLSSDNITISCTARQTLNDLIQAYTEKILSSLNNHPMAIQGRYAERNALAQQVEKAVAHHDNALSKRQADLAGLSSLIARIGLYIDTVRDLTASNAEYKRLRQEVGAFAPAILALPPDIGSQASENVSRPLSVFSILLSRLNYASTYLYSVLPLLMDILMLTLVYQAATLSHRRRVENTRRNQAADLDGTKVVLLWGPFSSNPNQA